MNHLEILEHHFNDKMLGVRLGFTTFDKFKRTHPSLLKVILDSMQEVENKANSNNLKQLK